jgi:hypothetical protein
VLCNGRSNGEVKVCLIFISCEIISLTCWLWLVRFRTIGSPQIPGPLHQLQTKWLTTAASPAWVGLGIPRRSISHTLLCSKASPALAQSANEVHCRRPERRRTAVRKRLLGGKPHHGNESGRFMHDMSSPPNPEHVHDRSSCCPFCTCKPSRRQIGQEAEWQSPWQSQDMAATGNETEANMPMGESTYIAR